MSDSFVVNGFPSWNLDTQVPKKVRPRHKIWAYWFPVISSAFTVASFVAGYIISVLNQDENPWFSFISDGGAISPESCIFGILLNFGAFFWLLTAASQHIYISQFMQFHYLHSFGWVFARRLLLFLAICSTIGLTVVANFQETNVPVAHGLGAWLAFFSGLVYVWIYIIISCITKPKLAPTCLTLMRGVFALITTFSLVIHITATNSAVFVKEDASGSKPPKPSVPTHLVSKYDYGDAWYVNHLVATISEWVLGVCFQIVVLTFAYELGSFTVTALNAEQIAETNEGHPELTNIKPLN